MAAAINTPTSKNGAGRPNGERAVSTRGQTTGVVVAVDAPALPFVITKASGPLRRRLTPTAWVVLEELVSTTNVTGLEVETNVRDLAKGLRISKDTVARAIQQLAAEELVERARQDNGTAGQFKRSRYRVDLAAAGLSIKVPVPMKSSVGAASAEPLRANPVASPSLAVRVARQCCRFTDALARANQTARRHLTGSSVPLTRRARDTKSAPSRRGTRRSKLTRS